MVFGLLAHKIQAAREQSCSPCRFECFLAHYHQTCSHLFEIVHELNEDHGTVRVAIFISHLTCMFPDRHIGISYQSDGYPRVC